MPLATSAQVAEIVGQPRRPDVCAEELAGRIERQMIAMTVERPFGRRLWEVALTGLPYAVFKVGGGLAAYHDLHPAIGVAVMGWGTIDAVLNVVSLVLPSRVAHCVLSNVGRAIDRRPRAGGFEQIGLAMDTLSALAIVATMIGFGRITTLPEPVQRIWGLSVIANILGVGIDRVWRSVRQVARE